MLTARQGEDFRRATPLPRVTVGWRGEEHGAGGGEGPSGPTAAYRSRCSAAVSFSAGSANRASCAGGSRRDYEPSKSDFGEHDETAAVHVRVSLLSSLPLGYRSSLRSSREFDEFGSKGHRAEPAWNRSGFNDAADRRVLLGPGLSARDDFRSAG